MNQEIGAIIRVLEALARRQWYMVAEELHDDRADLVDTSKRYSDRLAKDLTLSFGRGSGGARQLLLSSSTSPLLSATGFCR